MIKWIKNNFIKIILFFLILFLSFFVFNFLVSTKPIPKAKNQQENYINVNVVRAEIQNVTPFLNAFGKVNSQRSGTLSFGVSGKIEYLSNKFLDGTIVQKGETLAKLDKTKYLLEVKRLSSDYVELEKQLSIRKKQLKRNKVMLDKKVISPSKYDDELIKISQNKLELNRTKIYLQQAKKDLIDTDLKAKFEGLITDVNVSLGQFVSSSEIISKIQSVENLEVEFIVPSSIYSKAKTLIGKLVTVYWESNGKELVKIKAKIIRDEGIIREKDGDGKIYAVIENQKFVSIPPGSFVKVIYPIDTFVSVIKIPDSALFQNQYIFIENNGFSKKIKVNLLFKGQDYFLIDDLMLNQKNVIINRFSSDIEGKKIKIF